MNNSVTCNLYQEDENVIVKWDVNGDPGEAIKMLTVFINTLMSDLDMLNVAAAAVTEAQEKKLAEEAKDSTLN